MTKDQLVRIAEEALSMISAGWMSGNWAETKLPGGMVRNTGGDAIPGLAVEEDVTFVRVCSAAAMRAATARVLGVTSLDDLLEHPQYREAICLLGKTIHEMEEDIEDRLGDEAEILLDGDHISTASVEDAVVSWNDGLATHRIATAVFERVLANAKEGVRA